MSEQSEQIQAKNVALQKGNNNKQYITYNEIISRDVIKKTFNAVSPYKGLKKFEATAADSKHFFGRDQLIHLLMKELDQNNLLLLLGASGSGKSSVIQAGLIPRFEEKLGSNFKTFIFKPDRDPFLSLFIAFSREYGQDNANIAQLEKEDTLIEIVKTLKHKDHHWLIYIDQFEEIFHLSDEKKGKKFIKALVKLYQYLQESQDISVKLVMTMRTDFLDNFSAYPQLKDITITQKHLEMITDMKPDELRQAIEQPAAQNGVVFEDGLVNEIISDIKNEKQVGYYLQPGYLPLLQYTLDLLWNNDNNGVQDQTLNISTYRTLGGVRGALQKHVEAIYQKLSSNEQGAAKKIFLKLVDVKINQELGTLEKVVNNRPKVSEFKEESSNQVIIFSFVFLIKNGLYQIASLLIQDYRGLIQATLKKLIDNNLIVSQATIEGEATVEIAHEILLSSWETLRKWIEGAYQVIAIKNDLVKSLHRWKQGKENDKDFLTGSLLEEVKTARKNKTFDSLGKLTEDENKFITASSDYADRQKNEKIRTAQRIAAGSLVALVISSGLGLTAWNQKNQSELNQAESLGRYSFSLFNEQKELEAFVQAIKAGKILQSQRTTNPEVMNALHTVLPQAMERNRLEGHNQSELVSSVSFSPDSKTLASVGDNIKLWNAETGKEIRTLTGHDGVWSVSFSPDRKTLASGGKKTIKLWNLETGEEIRTLQAHDNLVSSVSFSPDGNTLASGSWDKTIKLWNVETGKEIRTFRGHDKGDQSVVWSVSFSPDGKTLASNGGQNTIKLWNVETGNVRTLKGHENSVFSLSFSPNGKILISGGDDRTTRLWHIDTGREIISFKEHIAPVMSVSFSPDSKRFASGGLDRTIKLWNLEHLDLEKKNLPVRTIYAHETTVTSLSFSPDGKTLASGGGVDKTIKLWNLETGNFRHETTVTSVSFSPDGKTLASGSFDKTIKLWNLETGKEIRTLTGHNDGLWSVSFSQDGKTLASGSLDKTIKVWNLETGKEIRTLTGHSDSVFSVSFSPDGKTLSSSSRDKTIKVWNLETGKEIRTLTGHNDIVSSVSFSPDGKTLASVSHDKTIKLWNLETGEEIRTLTGHNHTVFSVSFSPDGKTLASGSEGREIKLWNLETGEEIHTLRGHDSRVWSVNFSPDGKILASSSHDKTIKLWNVKTGKEIRTLRGHDMPVPSVSFSPDGKTLASGSEDKTIRLWNLDLDSLMGRSCDWVRDYLTYNSQVSESDKHLCDGIGTKK
jgi:WD40 repeat protein/energy-coupling factor transporter ATP-binding protein EcfA2